MGRVHRAVPPRGRLNVRVAVLPREEASRVITNALARAFAAINATSLVLAVPMLVEFMVTRGIGGYLPIPIVILAVLTGLSIFSAVRPNRTSLILFLVVGSIGAVVFQVFLVGLYPPFLQEALYVLNRPAVALVLVGITASTVRQGFAWSLVGFALSNVVTLAVALIAGVPFTPGYGAFLNLIAVTIAYGSLAAIQSSLRKRVPNFDEFEEQTRRIALQENLGARVTAAVHDTLLNDLSLIINAPDTLDERMRNRLRADVLTLTSAEWLQESSEVVTDEQDSDLRNRIMRMISDLQWRGLTVHITGSGSGIVRMPDRAPDVLVDAVRACLENVLQHSGADVAEVDLGYTDRGVTIVVSDHGSGFDPGDVPEDRLGLRTSVVERLRLVGGTAKIWSTPGEGTSVVMQVPVSDFVTPHEGMPHGQP